MADKQLWEHDENDGSRSGQKVTADTLDLSTTTHSPVGKEELDSIVVSNIVGPLVVLYGPANVGKTVTLLRLCSFIESGNYSVEVERNFRSDSSHAEAVSAFERQQSEEVLAPESTAAINFLLLNVTSGGTAYCQILEAPGEHFFSESDPEWSHPFYLQKIFQSPARKIFALFFEASLTNNDQRLKDYVKGIVDVLRRHADVRKDRVVLIFNKCDERADLSRNGRPIEAEFRRLLYANPSFSPLGEYLRSSRFARVHFVPFSSGQFGKKSGRAQTFAMSADHYPKALWAAIDDCVRGSWRLWPW